MPRDQDAINDHAEARRREAWDRAYEQAENELISHAEGRHRFDWVDAAIQARAEELMGER